MRAYDTTYADFFTETKKAGAGFCYAIKITPVETGSPVVPLRYSDHDEAFTVDGNVFSPATSFSVSAMRQKADASVDSLAIFGVTTDTVTEEDLIKGAFDDAQVDVYLACWTNPAAGLVPLKRGYLGELKAAQEGFEVDVRGLMEYLQRPFGRAYMGECDVREFGDTRCGLDIVGLGYVHTGTVTALGGNESPSSGNGRIFGISESQADGYFQFGKVTFTTGLNAGWSGEIVSHASDIISLIERPPYTVNGGDAIQLVRGCPRTWSACQDTFGNLVNFRGFGARKGTTFYFMPTDEVISDTPDV